MNEDGTMAKRPQLEAFADKHGIKLGTIADLIQYRNLYDKTIEQVDTRKLPTSFGEFDLHTYKDRISDCVHYALVKGEISEDEPCMVRVQVLNTLRDVLHSVRPGYTGSWSLSDSLAAISEEGKGVVVLVGQEYAQAEELSQVCHFPDIPPEQKHTSEAGVYRVVGTGSQILRDVGVSKMRLLSSPTRFNAISGFHLEVVEFVEKE
jgi:3,4-dihydroxy 2-butanone 4-phosphate synthase/GTP cyclohydrolase II